MQAEPTGEHWRELRFEEPTEFRAGEFLVKNFELNFNKLRGGFDDMINLIETDFKKHLLVGTEKGKIFVIDMLSKRVLSVIQSDAWLNSLFLFRSTVMASGCSRKVEGYSLRAQSCLFRFDPRQPQTAYGSKGIVFHKLNSQSFAIASIGYLRFMIFSTRSRKVLRVFEVPLFRRAGRPQPEPDKRVVVNYCALRVPGVICFMLKSDEHLYFFNCKTHRLLHAVKLYNQEELGSAIFLANSVMLPCRDFILVILQFRKNCEASDKVRTILYIHQVEETDGRQRVRFHFFLELKDFEIIYSQDIKPVAHQVMGVDEGFTLILGTSVGFSRCIVVDLHRKAYVPRTVIKKSQVSSRCSPDGDIAATLIYNNGTVSATSEGHLFHLDILESVL